MIQLKMLVIWMTLLLVSILIIFVKFAVLITLESQLQLKRNSIVKDNVIFH